jgi:hypothetical protein
MANNDNNATRLKVVNYIALKTIDNNNECNYLSFVRSLRNSAVIQ